MFGRMSLMRERVDVLHKNMKHGLNTVCSFHLISLFCESVLNHGCVCGSSCFFGLDDRGRCLRVFLTVVRLVPRADVVASNVVCTVLHLYCKGVQMIIVEMTKTPTVDTLL